MSLTIGSLFSGIGGLELGLEWAGLGPVVFQVEQEEYCRGVLAKHWPDAARFDDVRSVGAACLPAVDVICGGFPCQDISVAGKGAGLAGARSGLWFEYARIVGELRPRFVVVENVSALVTRGLDRVVGDLSALGYDAWWTTLRASDVGAPHRRERLFIIGWLANARRGSVQRDGGAGIAAGAAALGDGQIARRGRDDLPPAARDGGAALADVDGGRRGGERQPQHGDEPGASGRVADGRSSRRRRNGAAVADATHGGIRRGRAPRGEGLAALGGEGVGDADQPGRDERAGARSDERRLTEPAHAGDVGNPDLARLEGRSIDRRRAGQRAARAPGGADASDGRVERGLGGDASRLSDRMDPARWPAGPGSPQHEWEPPRVATGIPNRARRLKALGNAVVPQVAEVIGHVVIAIARTARARRRA